jgi:hypothetical protein
MQRKTLAFNAVETSDGVEFEAISILFLMSKL